MVGYFVTQDLDMIYLRACNKKQTVRKFRWYKNMASMKEDLIENNKPYYIYTGTVKPLDIWGVYEFTNGKLKRLGNDDYNFGKE